MKKWLGRFVLFVGFFCIFFLGFMYGNEYDMVFRAVGVIIAFTGFIQIIFSSRVRRPISRGIKRHKRVPRHPQLKKTKRY